MSMSNGTIVAANAVSKNFKRGAETIHVLQGLDLEIPTGEFLALMGPSGSGKSTLLNLIGGLDTPDAAAHSRSAASASTASAAASSPAGAPVTSASCSSSTICCRC